MTLQELLDRALTEQWFPLSYGTLTKRGPLQTYVKRYAQAFRLEPKDCHPERYHLPEHTVHNTLFRAAQTDLEADRLQPRSVQAGITTIVKLLHEGVARGCLPSLKPTLGTWRLIPKGRRTQRAIFPPKTDAAGKPVPLADHTPYGLKDWPLELAHDLAMYLQWCTPESARGRPVKIRKGAKAAYMVEMVVGQVAAYAVEGQGQAKETLTLRSLCEPALLEDWAWWWQERRGMWTSTIYKNLAIMKTLVRYWCKDEACARGIVEVIKRLKSEALPKKVRDREGRALSLEEVYRLGESLYPLNERRVKERYRLQVIQRHLANPETSSLPPGYGHFSHLAVRAGVSLIIQVLVHRPLRLGNLANLQFKHLKPQPQGGYRMVIPKAEIKNGKFMDRDEWSERFPTRLLPALETWLTTWRPYLPKMAGQRKVTRKMVGETSEYVFLNRNGRPHDVNNLSLYIILASVRLTQDRPEGPVAWYAHSIRRTFVKEMLHAGLNPYIIQRIIGDSFHVIDQHYGRFQDRPASAFAKQLAKEIEQGID